MKRYRQYFCRVFEQDADRTNSVPIRQFSDHNFQPGYYQDIDSVVLPQAFRHQAFHDSERYNDGNSS